MPEELTHYPWKELPICPTPKGFEKAIPLFEVIKGYELEGIDEALTVKRWFANCEEGLRINYDSKNFREAVTIKYGKILEVFNEIPYEPKEHTLEEVLRVLNPPKPKDKTFHNIKRFEGELKKLPWQSDLEAIYKGSGSFYE